MKVHELKIEPRYFQDIIDDRKCFEIRKNDRDFREGDILFLREYNNGKYTGREIRCIVSYVLKNVDGLADGYAILSICITFEKLW
ncbi:MAG: DUF3850 domain-containing protein [Clostridium sp.]|nr:DUF3850 domain-containing protein [Clostridium sp.]